MADLRECEQCGAHFAPRREHARFCSARCRDAWNYERTGGDAELQLSALQWSVRSMSTANTRLAAVREWDRPSAFAAIADLVWSATIVDAALVRYHPGSYDRVLMRQPAPQQKVIVDTLSGLRFVRNQIAHTSALAQFVDPTEPDNGSAATSITAWRWQHVPEPPLGSLSPGAQAWKLGRYRGYEAQLAGQTIGSTFGRVVVFLERTALDVGATSELSAHAAQ